MANALAHPRHLPRSQLKADSLPAGAPSPMLALQGFGSHSSGGFCSQSSSAGAAASSADPQRTNAAGKAQMPEDPLTGAVGADERLRGSVGGDAKRCAGCGAWLHSDDPEEHGYVPKEAREQFADSGRRKTKKEPKGVPVEWVPDGVEVLRNPSGKYRVRTRLLICQRCYRLQHYHRTIGPVQGGFYRMEGGREWEHEAEIVEKIVRRMRRHSLVLMIIDVMDFESSVVPELFDACRNRKFPVIFLVNKVDCLPLKMTPGSKGLENVKLWVRRMSRQIRNVHVNDVILISAANAYGFNQLEERLRHHLEPNDPRNIYVVGRVNAGKSTFVNRFLWYVGFKHQGTVFHSRAVGGVTRSPVPGTTLHFVSFGLPKGFRLVDTPGIPSRCQISGLLAEGIDLYSALPRKRLQPISYALHAGRSLLVGALARVDQVKGAFSFVTCFFSNEVTLHVCHTNRAEGLLERKKGDFFYPPHYREECDRIGPLVRHRVEVFGSSDRAWDDVVLAGLGWIAVSGFGTKELDVWVPRGVKVFRRPSILPREVKNHGVKTFYPKMRARGPRISRKKRGAVQARRDKELRDALRAEKAREEAERAETVEVPEGAAFVEEGLELPPGYEAVQVRTPEVIGSEVK